MAIESKSERHNPNVSLFWQRWALSKVFECLCVLVVVVVVGVDVDRICTSVIRQSCSADDNGTLVIFPLFIMILNLLNLDKEE